MYFFCEYAVHLGWINLSYILHWQICLRVYNSFLLQKCFLDLHLSCCFSLSLGNFYFILTLSMPSNFISLAKVVYIHPYIYLLLISAVYWLIHNESLVKVLVQQMNSLGPRNALWDLFIKHLPYDVTHETRLRYAYRNIDCRPKIWL